MSVKLLFDQEKLRKDGNGFIRVSQEAEVEVHASEGLEIFKYQVIFVIAFHCFISTLDRFGSVRFNALQQMCQR